MQSLLHILTFIAYFYISRGEQPLVEFYIYMKFFYLTAFKLFVLDSNTWNQIIGCKILISDWNTIVMWYPAETIEIRLILSSRRNEQWQTVKDTVKKECRSQRGYQQMLVLSNLRSPDTGREKEREAKWLAGTLKRKWHLLPVGEKNEKKRQLLEGARGRQTHSHYSGWRRQKHILDTRDPSSSSQY